MAKRRISALITMLLLAALLTACGPSEEEQNAAILATAESISSTMVAAQLTEIAELEPTATPPPTRTSTPTESGPTSTALPATGDCLRASLSDESIPDDTVLAGGQSFEKSWVLTNTGTCTWTEEFSLVFHHGNAMGAPQTTPLAGWVAPGESVILSLDMVAPSSPGSHIGFWSVLSPDGTYFGPSSTSTFWVRITVAGPTPTSIARNLAWASGGAVRSDGDIENEAIAGDVAANLGSRAFVTFNFGNLSDEATVTSVVLDLDEYSIKISNPFGALGCLNVYAVFYGGLDASDYDLASGTPLWRFCSVDELGGSARIGDADAIAAIQDALPGGQIQFAIQFDNETNSDSSPNQLKMNSPLLTINWYKSN